MDPKKRTGRFVPHVHAGHVSRRAPLSIHTTSPVGIQAATRLCETTPTANHARQQTSGVCAELPLRFPLSSEPQTFALTLVSSHRSNLLADDFATRLEANNRLSNV